MRALVMLSLLVLQEQDIDSLLKQLSDESIEVREKAATALVALGDMAEVRIRKELGTALPSLKARFESILLLVERDRRRRAVLPPLKRVTISAKDRNVRDVIDDFQRQTGIAVVLDGDVDQRMTLDIKDATPFDALFAFCRAGNFGFEPEKARNRPDRPQDLEQNNKIWLTPGAFLDVSRSTGRHYSVEPVSVMIGKKWHMGSVTRSAELALMARWLPGTAPANVHIRVQSVTDNKGRELFRAGTPLHSTWARENYIPHPLSELHEVSLDQPSDGACTLHSIKGSVIAQYAIGELKTVFKSPEKGQQREVDGLTVRLAIYRVEKEECGVTVVVEGQRASQLDKGPRVHKLIAHLENGLVREFSGFCGVVDDKKYTLSGSFHSVNAPIVSLEVIIETFYHDDSFDFELKDIPLPK